MKKINLSEIKVPSYMAQTSPNPKKIAKCKEYWLKHHEQDRYIVLNANNEIVDGYVQYLVLKEIGLSSAYIANSQYANEVVKYINKKVEGRFDGAYVIVPETYYTAQDIARGYSYTTKIKIYAPNMKTVQTLTVEAHRLTDLETTTAV